MPTPRLNEQLTGIVTRVTYHNPSTGWSVLNVEPFGQAGSIEKVTVHQTKVFAGATVCFKGEWRLHPKYGKQFYAMHAQEHKPASAAALEKYLGSGLIKGVGPKTARRIVSHFQEKTLEVFDQDIERLTEVPGIAQRKLKMIAKAWHEHSKIRDVMIFLQTHGISTLFAVRIYKAYGDKAIERVQENPYQLADDFYGIGFFSADQVARALGFADDSTVRVKAAIKHVLSASREQGHCYLTRPQIIAGVTELIALDIADRITEFLQALVNQKSLFLRHLFHPQPDQAMKNHSTSHHSEKNLSAAPIEAYYASALYHSETRVAERISAQKIGAIPLDGARVKHWIARYCAQQNFTLSASQTRAVIGIAEQKIAILTGGPGCGKTTTTRVIAKLFQAMQKRILLVAPTGRAAQRMTEVIGLEAKTIHRLLKWQGGQFQINEEAPLDTDVLIIDECSMLDITLADALLRALPANAQLLLIGDADQLPSVGPGNVLKDLIASQAIPCYHLTEIFRQAEASAIVQYAHQLNQGKVPFIASPFNQPDLWLRDIDCLFIDSDEATQAQLRFIRHIKRLLPRQLPDASPDKPSNEAADNNKMTSASELNINDLYTFGCDKPITSAYEKDFEIPKNFAHVDIQKLKATRTNIEAFKSVLKNIHPWSSLHYDLSATDIILKLYQHWIPKYLGTDTEIQVLSPMARGSLGTHNLNTLLQKHINPPTPDRPQLQIGQRILRLGDRVIHQRNNYDLNVYNGDIGKIIEMDTQNLTCQVKFEPDGRTVAYQVDDMMDLALAYAITIHKSQGSEFSAVIIPVLTQHFKMLYRNLLYTGLTRAKRFAIFVGTRRALALGAHNNDTSHRQTALRELLSNKHTNPDTQATPTSNTFTNHT